jgi:signal transduction histidine kinase
LRGHRFFGNEGIRLSALLMGLFVASALLLGGTAYWITDRAMRAELDDTISAEEGAVTAGYHNKGIDEAIEVVQQLTAVPGLAGRYLLQDARGRKLAGNLDAMPARMGLFEIAGNDAHRHWSGVFGRGRSLADGSYLFVGESAAGLARIRARILAASGWIIGATLLLATIAGALVSAGFLRRVDAITHTCRAIVAGRFGERIAVSQSNAQLVRLSATINEMLDRIDALLESLHQVSSDIAHDLRTPLTRLRQRLESTRERPVNIEQYRDTVDRALEDCDAILAIFSALLRISQIESGMRLAAFTAVDVPALLQQVAEFFAPVVEDAQQMLTVALAPMPAVPADRTLLMQMFSNLVENAIRHAGRGAALRIECRHTAEVAWVIITDSGPGIPASEREKVFGRLYRLERSRSTPGSGLGLALVAAIARLHQYTITLADAAPGLRVDVRMPLSRG